MNSGISARLGKADFKMQIWEPINLRMPSVHPSGQCTVGLPYLFIPIPGLGESLWH